ncbi:MAG: hypothetical protein LBL90_06595 [Prevotellaceae bacterium]|jgi:hypothetical protein|nr:hypothetical protein [Prevotellaceae bacterium]
MDNNFIANLLISLLAEYNRISLPCLGSFMGQYKPAYFSDDGSTIYPPSKQIEFHQNEIWNDERLEKLIAERENISLGGAKEKIAFWIDDICVRLSMGETVSLPHFGEFVVSYGNRLKFIQYNERNLLLDSFGFELMKLETGILPAFAPEPSSPDNKNRFNNLNTNNNTLPPKKKISLGWLWITLSSLFLFVVLTIALIHFRIVNLPDSVLDKYPWIEYYLRDKGDKIDDRSLFLADEDYDYDYDNYKQYVDTIQTQITPPLIDTGTVITDSLLYLSDSTEIVINDSIINDTISVSINELYHIVVNTTNNYNDARTIAKEWAKKDYVVQILYTEDKEPYKLSVEYYNSEKEAKNKLEEHKKNDSAFKNAVIFKHIAEE